MGWRTSSGSKSSAAGRDHLGRQCGQRRHQHHHQDRQGYARANSSKAGRERKSGASRRLIWRPSGPELSTTDCTASWVRTRLRRRAHRRMTTPTIGGWAMVGFERTGPRSEMDTLTFQGDVYDGTAGGEITSRDRPLPPTARRWTTTTSRRRQCHPGVGRREQQQSDLDDRSRSRQNRALLADRRIREIGTPSTWTINAVSRWVAGTRSSGASSHRNTETQIRNPQATVSGSRRRSGRIDLFSYSCRMRSDLGGRLLHRPRVEIQHNDYNRFRNSNPRPGFCGPPASGIRSSGPRSPVRSARLPSGG